MTWLYILIALMVGYALGLLTMLVFWVYLAWVSQDWYEEEK